MDGRIGIGRAVVEHKVRLALVAGHHLVVDPVFLPLLQHLGFSLGKSGPHGKVGLRQIQRLVVILRHCRIRSLMLLLIFPMIPATGGYGLREKSNSSPNIRLPYLDSRRRGSSSTGGSSSASSAGSSAGDSSS